MNESSTAITSRKLVVVGAGGFGLEVLWVVSRENRIAGGSAWNVIGFVDDDPKLRGVMVEGLPVLGPVDEFIARYHGTDLHFHCALGNNALRQSLAEKLEAAGFQPATLMDPSAIVSPRVEIGAGTYVGPNVTLSLEVRIGRHVLINGFAGIGHHCTVGDYAQICPGVRVSGNCEIGKLAFLGSNAVIHPGCKVGEGATVGGASFATRHVPAGALVVGVPAAVVVGPRR